MRLILTTDAGAEWNEAAHWVLGEMLEALGLDVHGKSGQPGPTLRVHYGAPCTVRPGDAAVLIPGPPAEMPDRYLPPSPDTIVNERHDSCPSFPAAIPVGGGRPLWRRPSGEAAVWADVQGPSVVQFGFDWVAPAFSLLSCASERDAEHDDLGRVKAETTWLKRNDFLEAPAVDQLGRLLLGAIEESLAGAGAAILRKEPWPGGQEFAISLTHDQDQSVLWHRRLARHLLDAIRGGPLGREAAVRLAMRDMKEGAVAPTVLSDRLVDRQIDAGIRSSFYFMTVKEDRFDRRYNVLAPPFRRLLHRLGEQNFEVGLHGSLDSYTDPAVFSAEKGVIEEASGATVEGVRQHYLRIKIPGSWAAQRDAGFRYDGSLGFPDHPGFRAGTSFPFRPRDVDRFLVIPLSGMDRALFAARVRTADRWDEWVEPVRKVGGLVEILWHPYFTDTDFGQARGDAIDTLLEWLADRQNVAWTPTLGEAARWWDSRRFFRCEETSTNAGKTICNFRSSVEIPALTLTPLPRTSDIEIESVKHAILEVGGNRGERSVRLGEIESGATARIRVRPPGGRNVR